jgi:fructose-bisphosphate aldolase class 1
MAHALIRRGIVPITDEFITIQVISAAYDIIDIDHILRASCQRELNALAKAVWRLLGSFV